MNIPFLPWESRKVSHADGESGWTVTGVTDEGTPVDLAEYLIQPAAELLAAAPTMLDLLESFCDAYDGDDGLDRAMAHGGLDVHVVAARALLAELNETAAAFAKANQ